MQNLIQFLICNIICRKIIKPITTQMNIKHRTVVDMVLTFSESSSESFSTSFVTKVFPSLKSTLKELSASAKLLFVDHTLLSRHASQCIAMTKHDKLQTKWGKTFFIVEMVVSICLRNKHELRICCHMYEETFHHKRLV